MSIHNEFSCSECGFKLDDVSNIFWIDYEGNVHVDILTVQSSEESSNALVSGGIYKYYCYGCGKFIYNFHINEKSDAIEKFEIIHILESIDENTKIIDFDNKFQNCINCGAELELKLEKSFALDEEGEFFIDDPLLNDFSDKNLDFNGKYYGYYCNNCSKQINKFVIFENNANLTDSLMKEILEDHTNDLTVFINDSYGPCPQCGSELHVLDQSSKCPNCETGTLNLVNKTLID